jgi:hypothetical protein
VTVRDLIPLLTPTQQRQFAAWCARRALCRERLAGREPDARSWAAVEAAGRITEEFSAAEGAAAWAAEAGAAARAAEARAAARAAAAEAAAWAAEADAAAWAARAAEARAAAWAADAAEARAAEARAAAAEAAAAEAAGRIVSSIWSDSTHTYEVFEWLCS